MHEGGWTLNNQCPQLHCRGDVGLKLSFEYHEIETSTEISSRQWDALLWSVVELLLWSVVELLIYDCLSTWWQHVSPLLRYLPGCEVNRNQKQKGFSLSLLKHARSAPHLGQNFRLFYYMYITEHNGLDIGDSCSFSFWHFVCLYNLCQRVFSGSTAEQGTDCHTICAHKVGGWVG